MFLLPITALAEGNIATEAYTWEYLGTIAGAAAATLLIVQYTKAPLDKVWKMPTRLYVYIIATAIMLLSQTFTAGVTIENVALILFNSVIVSVAAYGSYEVTFGMKS